jgi:CASK-interacting protein
MEMHFEEYALLFSQAGYDLATISRMTPEDLTAIGIKKPHHREKIKQHIDNLQLPDQLPNFVPGSIDEWLRLLRLDEYIQHLLAQGYKSVVDVTQITWEDLEDIGIVRLGHQKKILLAIKRVKDIINGKWVPSNFQQYQQHILPQVINFL